MTTNVFRNECITTAAPCAKGLQITGEEVLSMINGIPCFLPISATSLIGKTLRYGFGHDFHSKLWSFHQLVFQNFLDLWIGKSDFNTLHT